MRALTEREFEELLGERKIPKHPRILEVDGYNGLESVDEYPLLYRGCHLCELDADVKMSDIQGRKNDTSYNGNVLHLTSKFESAFGYAHCNSSSEQFADKRTCVVAYQPQKLSSYGSFEPDRVDSDTNSAIESLKKCGQVRWRCYSQIARLTCIEFVIYRGKSYQKEDLPMLITSVEVSQPAQHFQTRYLRLDNLETKEQHYLRISQRISGILYVDELEDAWKQNWEPSKIIFDSTVHSYLSMGGYLYAPNHKVMIHEYDVELETVGALGKGSPDHLFHHHFITFLETKPVFLFRAVYPIKI
ncbi:Hypothetical protein POVR1_LOCUS413 [uncultured virus]|nr:Hypothetical protein POVR1_LOCUS413 [uncultured virus]